MPLPQGFGCQPWRQSQSVHGSTRERCSGELGQLHPLRQTLGWGRWILASAAGLWFGVTGTPGKGNAEPGWMCQAPWWAAALPPAPRASQGKNLHFIFVVKENYLFETSSGFHSFSPLCLCPGAGAVNHKEIQNHLNHRGPAEQFPVHSHYRQGEE